MKHVYNLVLLLIGTFQCVRSQCLGCEYDNTTAECWSLFLESVPTCLPETITILDLWDNNITLTDDSFQSLPNLEEIYLDANGISEIPLNAFRDLTNLTTLSFVDNALSSVQPNLFSNNPKLSFIDLTLNELEDADIIFSDMAGLQVFYAPKNRISDLGVGSQQLINNRLLLLDLSNNLMTTLEPSPFNTTMNLQVNLLDNPWFCDCSIYQVKELLEAQGATFQEYPICVGPPNVEGVSWKDLQNPC